jgi:hypothetical protein
MCSRLRALTTVSGVLRRQKRSGWGRVRPGPLIAGPDPRGQAGPGERATDPSIRHAGGWELDGHSRRDGRILSEQRQGRLVHELGKCHAVGDDRDPEDDADPAPAGKSALMGAGWGGSEHEMGSVGTGCVGDAWQFLVEVGMRGYRPSAADRVVDVGSCRGSPGGDPCADGRLRCGQDRPVLPAGSAVHDGCLLQAALAAGSGG